ncbi:uncharacterized protein E0L32_000982 [Thyridium curvatum]|uniref:LysM domain-containing protein n=1 Tax=Thyridium curvatum TaxID=1093900 RepID=A0A507AXH8_9PEZI|nr:uncharacterized protein E0L32_000982 [Thyridium curvatum]TPX11164.1 hypothetical protein E0L32_000982 [Thyridium curvatum]
MQEACCTCARLLSADPGRSGSEKKNIDGAFPEYHRRLDCCGRVICRDCTSTNTRFATYCPYCQISSCPSALPPGGLRAPPPYGASAAGNSKNREPPCRQRVPPAASDDAPPPYAVAAAAAETNYAANDDSKAQAPAAEAEAQVEDVLHFLDHDRDTVASLSLRYGVPAAALRAANRLPSDALLAARRAVVIPSGSGTRRGPGPGGGLVSLSPRPVGGEAEELRKAKIRRWMVACKEADYDVAVLYLEGADYDLALATEAYLADEEWERAHPVEQGAGRSGASRTGKAPSSSLKNRFRFGKGSLSRTSSG